VSVSERAVVTILFTDLVNSTDLLARAGDDEAQRIFRAHHDLLAETATAHQGEEVKWLGDGLMVAFPSAADAVQCGVAMQQASRRPVQGERIGIRVGLNAGEVLRDAADYFGLPVVVARRLCDRAQAGEILCTDVVAGLLMGRTEVTFVDLGKLELKGVPHPVAAFAVHYEAQGRRLCGRMPFVGRGPEIDLLRHRWDETMAGRSGLVLVAGEPGIGKTRLVEELVTHAERDGAAVLWGHCLEGDWMPPYAPFVEAFETLVGGADPDALRLDVGGGGSALARLVPALRAALPGLPDAEPLQPDEERFRLIDSLSRLLVACSARRPLLVCLDDLQWADQGTVDALRHVVRAASGHRILVAGTYRDAETGPGHPLTLVLGAIRRETDYQRVPLAGLRADEVGQLLDSMAEHDVPGEVVNAIATETDGNPFFIREVLRLLIEEGKLRRGPDGRWSATLSVSDLGIPEGVREVVARRVARLSTSANLLLRTACAFEGSFRLDVVLSAGGLPDDEGLDVLDEALAARLVEPAAGPETYTFTHALIRHTLYADLSPSRQSRLHRKVAEALEAVIGPDPSPATVGAVAVQYHRSRSLPGAERGLEPALAAADHAVATGGQAEAARFLRIALDLLRPDDARHPRLLGRLGLALIWSLAFDEGLVAASAAGDAIAAAEGAEAAAAYLADAALAMGTMGNNPRAWDLGRQGLVHVGGRRDLTWARLAVLDFQAREHLDPDHPGIPHDTPERWEAARILRAAGSDPAGFPGLEVPLASRAEMLRESVNLSLLVCMAGEFTRCVESATAEAQRGLDRGQTMRAIRCFMALAFSQISLGHLADGATALESAERLLAPTGMRLFGVLHAREMHASYRDDEAELDRLSGVFHELLPTLVPGQAWALGSAHAIAARTAARLGRLEEALHHLECLVPWLERAPGWTFHYAHLVGHAGETLWLLGRLDHAEKVERALRDKVVAPDFRDIEVDGRLGLARLCTLAGRYDEAVGWFADARRVLIEQSARPLLAIIDFDEASMLERRGLPGDGPAARRLLEAALEQFFEIGMTGWASRARARLGLPG
jgi:class 3 adenylate cyclase/tetratricopeptide (TPR) repeat protein